jgi:hypothetical protein
MMNSVLLFLKGDDHITCSLHLHIQPAFIKIIPSEENGFVLPKS